MQLTVRSSQNHLIPYTVLNLAPLNCVLNNTLMLSSFPFFSLSPFFFFFPLHKLKIIINEKLFGFSGFLPQGLHWREITFTYFLSLLCFQIYKRGPKKNFVSEISSCSMPLALCLRRKQSQPCQNCLITLLYDLSSNNIKDNR